MTPQTLHMNPNRIIHNGQDNGVDRQSSAETWAGGTTINQSARLTWHSHKIHGWCVYRPSLLPRCVLLQTRTVRAGVNWWLAHLLSSRSCYNLKDVGSTVCPPIRTWIRLRAQAQ
eukprot:3024385-Amphidinium_carterae.1